MRLYRVDFRANVNQVFFCVSSEKNKNDENPYVDLQTLSVLQFNGFPILPKSCLNAAQILPYAA